MFKTLTGTTSLLGECPVWCERIERLFWTDMNDRFWPISAFHCSFRQKPQGIFASPSTR